MLLINKVCKECILNGFHKFNCIERKNRNKHECLINRIIVLTSNLHAFKNIFFQNNAILRIKIFHYIIHFTGKTILKNSESRKKSGEAKVTHRRVFKAVGKRNTVCTKRKSQYCCEYYNEIVIKPSCFLYTNAALNASL